MAFFFCYFVSLSPCRLREGLCLLTLLELLLSKLLFHTTRAKRANLPWFPSTSISSRKSKWNLMGEPSMLRYRTSFRAFLHGVGLFGSPVANTNRDLLVNKIPKWSTESPWFRLYCPEHHPFITEKRLACITSMKERIAVKISRRLLTAMQLALRCSGMIVQTQDFLPIPRGFPSVTITAN